MNLFILLFCGDIVKEIANGLDDLGRLFVQHVDVAGLVKPLEGRVMRQSVANKAS